MQALGAWARARVAAAEPRIGVLGPVAWVFEAILLAAAAYAATSVQDSGFFVAGAVAVAGLFGLATAPFWMVRVAILGHRRRHREARAEATTMRVHLEEAYVEGRVGREELARLDERLALHRRGRAPGAVARTAAVYLRGVAWGLLGAGILVALGGLLLAADMASWKAEAEGGEDRAFAEDWQGIGLATATTAGAVAVGAAVVFGSGAMAAERHGKRLLDQDAAELASIRQTLLEARRT